MARKLGQYMTPPRLAALAAAELGRRDVVIDFAVGEGALLRAVQKRAKGQVELIGVDLDRKMAGVAEELLQDANIRVSDGLKARLPAFEPGIRLGVIGNPPYCALPADFSNWTQKAFPGLAGKHGLDRAEVQFLARALVTAREHNGKVVMIMPIGFADGDFCRKVRSSLMENYGVIKCIEVESGAFSDTEARTVVLVVDTAKPRTDAVSICALSKGSRRPHVVWEGELAPGSRLDARYHRAISATQTTARLRLKDLEISVTRGLISKREALDNNLRVIHTTDLAEAANGVLPPACRPRRGKVSGVLAQPGDILLPRTGTRVAWSPVVVRDGAAPITDHIFRIRVPVHFQELVYNSFHHPHFPEWLKGISKGVCAAVITKRELMEMPVFALADVT